MQSRIAEKISALLASPAPPDLVLNRHCTECEFQACCRQKAIAQDDLSLLAGLSQNQPKKLHSKGIFTITQLSYTFRSRRRPARLRSKRERYHSLRALAIRKKKIHIVGRPELTIEGTPTLGLSGTILLDGLRRSIASATLAASVTVCPERSGQSRMNRAARSDTGRPPRMEVEHD